jgi:anti-sigma-K factor RskA
MSETQKNGAAWSPEEESVRRVLTQHLDNEVQDLDFNVTSKLAAARHRALSQETSRSIWSRLFGWQSVAGGSAALVVALMVGNQMLKTDAITASPQPADLAASGMIEDLAMLAEGDDIEFYQDIEFLEWLESNSS